MKTEFEGLITRKEAAAILRCSITTLKRIERRKELQPIQITPLIIGYRQSDLQRYIYDRTKV